MTDTPDPIDDAVLDEARSTLPTYVVAESPDGNVLSHKGDYPDDDTPVWIDGAGSDDATVPMGDLYAQYGDDLIAYAEPEETGIAASLAEAPPLTVEQAVEAVLSDMADTLGDGATVLHVPSPLVDSFVESGALREAAAEVTEACGAVTASLALAVDEPLDTPEEMAAQRQAILDQAIAGGWTREQAEEMLDTGIVRTPDGTLYGVVLPEGADTSGLPADVQEMLAYEAERIAPAPDPDPAEDTSGITAAMGHDALTRVEAMLSEAEDRLGITAALNGPGAVSRPVQRMAVGGNTDAQAAVVAAFEAGYRDDVTEFVEDVLGPRPDPDTPEHDQEAWDSLAGEARLWHAQQTGRNVVASMAARDALVDDTEIVDDIGDSIVAALTPDA